jgi:tetratricopeptide (TPR) repeat protein
MGRSLSGLQSLAAMLLVLAELAGIMPGRARAQPVQEGTTLNGLKPADLFGLADAAKAQGRPGDAKAIYRALSHDPDVEIRSEARFRLGQLLASEKRYKDAAITFRALLDEKPDAARVRLELARVLALMGDPDGAHRQIRQAEASGLPPDVATVVDQFANALRSTKRFGASVEVSLAPDTNINRATSATTLDTIIAPLTLDRDARARSGVGVKLGGQGYARLPVAPEVNLLGRASASASLYGEHQFDDVSGSLAIGPELNFRHDRLQPAVTATRRYYGGAFYAQTEGGSVNWMHLVGRRGQIETEVSVSRARYALNRLQDGMIYDGSVAVERAFSAKLGAILTLSADRQTALDPGYATTSGGPSFVVWRDLGKVTIYGTGAYRHLVSDERLFLYPRSRTDDYFRFSAGASFRKLAFAGLAPVVRLAWERNASTIGIYDYRRLFVETGITRAF